MRCPHCGNEESKVVDSRAFDDGTSIRRRRECLSCSERFTTYERREETPLIVIKSDGGTEPFDRNKLLRGLLTATVKRDVTLEQLEGIIDDIESELRNSFQSQIESKRLGDMVLMRLLVLDKVAYIRFASVYKDFQDLDEFTSELRKLR